jgi:3-methylcrotonyl-CoA carboxylase alpha subunit
VDTGLIARDQAQLVATAEAQDVDWAQAAAAALGVLGPLPETAGFHLWQPMEHSVVLAHAGHERRVALQVLGADRVLATPDGGAAVCLQRRGAPAAGWQVAGAVLPHWVRLGADVTVFRGAGLCFAVVDPLQRAASGAAAGNVIEAPMPGLVRAVFATPGQRVAAGDRLALLEAMKMEHALLAARDGIVAEVLVAAGAQVEAGAALIRLEDEAEEAA